MRQTIIVLGARDAIRWLCRAIPLPGTAPPRLDPEFQRELEHLRTEHADDPNALQDAVMRVYRERHMTANSCLPFLVRGAVVAANRAPIPFLAERRTIADMLAGTKFVRSEPSRWTRLRRWRRAPSGR